MNHFKGLVLSLCLLAATFTYGYDLNTHYDISISASDQSVLGIDELRAQLGLRYPISSLNRAQIFPGTRDEPTSVRNLIANGAMYEDDFPPGPIYHFLDPRTNSPLHINFADYPAVSSSYVDFINSHARTSPDWVVLGQGASPYEVNYWSFIKAREYFLASLTSFDRGMRFYYSGLLFDSL